jgi:hypothetical protein
MCMVLFFLKLIYLFFTFPYDATNDELMLWTIEGKWLETNMHTLQQKVPLYAKWFH